MIRKRTRFETIARRATATKRPRTLSYHPTRPHVDRGVVSKSRTIAMRRPLRNFGHELMPRMFQTKFVHTEDNYTLSTGGAASYSLYVFRGNSLYDPDQTGVGRTVSGHAEMAALYNHYRVLGSRITVQFYGSTFTQKGIRCIIAPDRATAIAGASPQNELNAHVDRVEGMLTEEKAVVQLKSYCRTATMYGCRSVDDVDYSAAFGANPTNQWYWWVGITSGTNDVVKASVTIEYFTVCYDNKNTYGSAL